MTDQLKDVRRLLPILDMAYEAEQMKMARLTARVRDLRMQLAGLERPVSSDGVLSSPAVRAGADMRWRVWADQRKRLINGELADAISKVAHAREGMAAALTKREAARQIEARLKAAAKRDAERRSSW